MKEADRQAIALLNQIHDAQAAGGAASFASLTGNPEDNAALDAALDAKQNSLGFTAENVANRRTTFQVTPDDTHYPTEKLVKDSLDAKQASLGFTPVPNTRTVNGHALSADVTVSKSDVGLGSADNTADSAKPVSTAQQTALDLKANLASPALTGNPTAPTQAAGDNSTKIATTAYANNLVPYKVYTALLTQSGTDAPVATVLQNTLGGTVVWTYDSVGIYTGTLVGAFVGTIPKVFGLITGSADPRVWSCERAGDDTVTVRSFAANSPTDSLLSDTFIEIRVYPNP